MRLTRLLAAIPAVVLLGSLHPETVPASPPADEPAPIKALLVCGGCCHDYEHQKHIIADGLAERAHIEVTVVHQGGTATDSKIPLYENPDWAKGYDIIIHDECFSGVGDKEYVDTDSEAACRGAAGGGSALRDAQLPDGGRPLVRVSGGDLSPARQGVWA